MRLSYLIKADYRAYGLTPFSAATGLLTLHSFWLIVSYRLAHWLAGRRVRLLPGMLRALGVLLWSADIAPSASIGPGFRVAHSVGIVIGGGVKAGANLEVFQNVTIGGRDRTRGGVDMPEIGDNVTIFAGAAVLGPISIGHNSAIGANSVVIADIPPDSVVAGVPAAVIGTVGVPHSLRSMGQSKMSSLPAIR